MTLLNDNQLWRNDVLKQIVAYSVLSHKMQKSLESNFIVE